MKTRAMFVLTIISALAFCLAATQPALASDEDEAMQVMNTWFKAFNASDYNQMSTLWWKSSDTTRFGPEEVSAFLMQGIDTINEFWESSLGVPSGTYVNVLHHPQVTMVGNGVAVITLYNTSTYTDPTTNEQSIAQVRGTFVVQKIGGRWLIVHEHSSVLPTE